MIAERGTVERLFRHHHGWLKGWLTRRFRNVSAEDVASEVFLRLMMRSYADDLREPRAMMTTIACRIVNELRRRATLWNMLQSELTLEHDELAPSPEDKLLILEALRTIDALLATLSPKTRAAFLFSRIDGMSNEEIARRLDVSTRTVERYLSHAMRLALERRRDG